MKRMVVVGAVGAVGAGVLAAAIGGLVVAGIVGGGDGSEGGAGRHEMAVELSNWKVGVDHVTMPAGAVVFRAMHVAEDQGAGANGHGDMGGGHAMGGPGSTHNLVVLKRTDDGYTAIGRTRDLAMGEKQTLKLTLAAGDYVLVCDVVDTIDGTITSHTVQGMRTELQVS